MRHRKAGKKLGRDSAHRRAVLRNLATSLFRYEEISTTHAKAKALRPIAEKMITLAKRGDLHARRQALSYIMDKSVAHKLFDQMKDRLSDHQGGCIRILKTGNRIGDNAPLAIITVLLKDEAKKSGQTAKKEVKGKKKTTRKPSDKNRASKPKTKVSEDKKEKVENP
ncbi:MAG: 50S ribosomal protein L17 [Desulfatiglandales bacterium]